MTGAARRRAAATLHVGAFLWAFASTLLGAALPLINQELHLGYAASGSIFTVSSAGFLIGSLLSGALSTRVSGRILLIASIGALLPCLAATAWVESYPALLTVVILAGIAGGGLTTVVNATISNLYAERRASALSLLNVSFGGGALIAPLVSGAVIGQTDEWRPLYHVTSLLTLALLVLAIWWMPRAYDEDSPDQPDEDVDQAPVRANWFTMRWALTFMAVFLAAAVEWGFAYWSATYFRDVLGSSAALAANMVSLFWAGMLIGRLAFGGLLRRADPYRMVSVCAWSAIAAGTLLAANVGVAFSVVGAVLLGGSLAAVIPSLLALAIDKNPKASGAISGVLMFASGGGSLTAPAIVGAIADRSSLALAMWLIPALAAALLVVHLAGGDSRTSPLAVPGGGTVMHRERQRTAD